MTKVRELLCKRSDLTWDEFQRDWHEQHGPLPIRLPGLRRYVHNQNLDEGNPPYGIAEFYFDNPEAFHAALVSPEGETALADLSYFVDLERTGMTVVAAPLEWRATAWWVRGGGGWGMGDG